MPAKKSSSNDKKRSTATASEADPPSAAPTAVAAAASSSVKTEATAGKSKKTTRTVVVERTAAELGIRQRKLAHADDVDPTLQMLTQASAAAFTQEDQTGGGSSTPPPLGGGAAVAAVPTTASQRIAGAVVRAVAESGAGSSRRQQFSKGTGDEDDDDLDAAAGGGPGRSKKKSRSELHGTTSGASRVNCRALATAQFNGALAALAAQPHHKQAFDICENSIVRRAGAAMQVRNSLSSVTAREATTARVPAATVDVQSSNNPHDDPTRRSTAAAMDAAARRGLWGPLVPAAWCYGHSSSSALPSGSDGRQGGVCLPLTAAEAGWGPTQLLSSAGGAPSKHTELGVSAAASCYIATELADRSAVASTTMSVLVAGALRAADTRDRPMVSVNAAPPSVCCVCMGTARYTCVRCLGSNAVVCSSTCLQAHVATRCLKFVV